MSASSGRFFFALKKIEGVVVRAEEATLVALIAGMTALAFGQIVLRQFFDTGLLWADPLLRHLVVVAGFLGAAVSARENKHLAMEFEWPWTKTRLGKIFKTIGLAAAAIVAVLLCRAAWDFFRQERASGDVLLRFGRAEVPEWAFSATIPVGFALVFFHYVFRFLESLRSGEVGGEKAAGPP